MKMFFGSAHAKNSKAIYVTTDEGIEECEGGQNWKHQKCKSVKKSGQGMGVGIKYHNEKSCLKRGMSGVNFHSDITNITKREKRNDSVSPNCCCECS